MTRGTRHPNWGEGSEPCSVLSGAIIPVIPPMAAIIMDGRALSAHLMPELRANVDVLKSKFGCTPSLAAILVGDDPASRQYVKNKERAAAELGCDSRTIRIAAAEASTGRGGETVDVAAGSEAACANAAEATSAIASEPTNRTRVRMCRSGFMDCGPHSQCSVAR